MALKILDPRSVAGGHKSFDFVFDLPVGEIKESEIFRQGVDLEKKVLGRVLVESEQENGKKDATNL